MLTLIISSILLLLNYISADSLFDIYLFLSLYFGILLNLCSLSLSSSLYFIIALSLCSWFWNSSSTYWILLMSAESMSLFSSKSYLSSFIKWGYSIISWFFSAKFNDSIFHILTFFIFSLNLKYLDYLTNECKAIL